MKAWRRRRECGSFSTEPDEMMSFTGELPVIQEEMERVTRLELATFSLGS
jgi:hypothetical protein